MITAGANGRSVLVTGGGIAVEGDHGGVTVSLTEAERHRIALALGGYASTPVSVPRGQPWIVRVDGSERVGIKPSEWLDVDRWRVLAAPGEPDIFHHDEIELIVPLVRPLVDAPNPDIPGTPPGSIWLTRFPWLGPYRTALASRILADDRPEQWVVVDTGTGTPLYIKDEDIVMITELFPAW